MSQICPHCGHARNVREADVPDWQCPACQRAYNKTGGELAAVTGARPLSLRREGGDWGKWLLIVALVLGGAWLIRPRPLPPVNPADGQPAVVLYSTSWCGYCAATRDFLRANGIAYTEQDIERSTAAHNEFRTLGGQGVPLVLIGGQVIRGYDEGAMRQQLAPWLRR